MNRCCPGATSVALLVGLALACGAAEIELRVTGNRVNLRAAPDESSESVGQASAGDLLLTPRFEGEWIAVAPPRGVDLWVYGQLVKDGRVAVPTLRVRSGPGINYRAVGLLEKGAELTVRGERDDWLMIDPPDECVLWIKRQYVKPTASPVRVPSTSPDPPVAVAVPRPASREARRAPEPSPPPVSPPRPSDPDTVGVRPETPPSSGARPTATVPRPAPRPVPERFGPVHASPPPAPPFDPRQLVDGREQGADVRLTGVLQRAGWVWRRPSPYRLVTYDEAGRAMTSCYVVGDASELEANLGSPVTLHGKAYWLQGVRHRVVVIHPLNS